MKVGKKKTQNPSIFLATYLKIIKKNSGDLETLFFLKSGKFGSFFPWKILHIGRNQNFQVEFW
jgi:hypothetical protein